MQGFTIVHSGEVWAHEALPCSRSMIKHLERNECVVTWVQVRMRALTILSMQPDHKGFQPLGGGVQDQVPVIRVGDSFFSMSLRMMKAVW